ncbi:collagen alpha-5(VI) chain [Biomphalaria pfeifferi]|uniref:Collagen alpha-5(VI) chain n=1 Tax=Biomphalaria pfeifferi TaxID=112525 RepID=A0AAD8BUB0_BIOPF|nr:collagen alpha-5(VI) chain [Biomphalaria pfeifferi]
MDKSLLMFLFLLFLATTVVEGKMSKKGSKSSKGSKSKAPTTTKQKLTTTTKAQTTTTKAPTTTKAEPETCNVKMGDIIFILDVSHSVGFANFEIEKNFVANMTTNYNISATEVRMGLLNFDYVVRKNFDLKDHLDKNSLKKAITSIEYPNSTGTYTYKALEYVLKENMFSLAAGGRVYAPDIIIVITDGASSDKTKTKEAAKKLKDKNIKVMVVGIGIKQSNEELRDIASADSMVFSVTDFSRLANIEQQLFHKACEVVATSTTTTRAPLITLTTKSVYPPPPDLCKGKNDIVFVLDTSTSIGPKKLLNETTLAANLIDFLTNRHYNVRFGALIFNLAPQKIFDLKDFTDRALMRETLLGIQYPNIPGTFTDKALSAVNDFNMFGTAAGGRDDAPDIIILMTDGISRNTTKTIAAANVLKNINKTAIITIGIGNNLNVNELKAVASSPAYQFDSQTNFNRYLNQLTC